MSAPFWMINYMIALGWCFQIELFQVNRVKCYRVTLWNGMTAVTNDPKQVVESVNLMIKPVHSLWNNKLSNVFCSMQNYTFLGIIPNLECFKIWIEKKKSPTNKANHSWIWSSRLTQLACFMNVNNSNTRTRIGFSKVWFTKHEKQRGVQRALSGLLEAEEVKKADLETHIRPQNHCWLWTRELALSACAWVIP